ncbi:hypothetical protein [Puerhibacterium puerhi]|uniref:hypothetical protein n=1 Tax=Puerhibacterium puerhi TaxID=2692623 RepID=UPI001357CD75|nr:hypothetical protein [Puerhibacterium puerhi]
MSDPNRPYDAVPGSPPPAVPPREPAVPPATAPAPAPGRPATSGTEDPRLGLEVGRYWGGAVATVVVTALVGLVAAFLVDRVAGQELLTPPFGDDDLVAWTVASALFALAAAVLLHLCVAATPRPASFFGWIVALATVVLAAVPFANRTDLLPAVLTAVVWIVIGLATWSLLTGVLARTLVRRPAV